MRNFNDELPFGKIKDKNVAKEPDDPLCFAEHRSEKAILEWEGLEFINNSGEDKYKIVTRDEEKRKEFEVPKEAARLILKLVGGCWNYAE